MFPFNLPGPEFLAFYFVFACAVIAALHFGRRYYEAGAPPAAELNDPLLFACLRGGPQETVRVATLGLIDRGLLKIADRVVTRAPEAGPALVHRRLERELLRHFNSPAEIDSVVRETSLLRTASDEYETPLRRDRLLPDSAMLNMRFRFLIVALAALLGVGGLKLLIAFSAGRGNVMILIVLMVGAVIWAFAARGPYRTTTGQSYLVSIRSMFHDLQERASSIRLGSGSRELLWLTALFGAAAVPTATFPFVEHLWPKTDRGKSSGCGTSCGGGCGGGGGGGGCGGCGS